MGEALSKKLGYYYFDTDQLIEDVAGRSIPAIFAEDGEESFRDLEQQIMEQMCAFTRAVVSTVRSRLANTTYFHCIRMHGLLHDNRKCMEYRDSILRDARAFALPL